MQTPAKWPGRKASSRPGRCADVGDRRLGDRFDFRRGVDRFRGGREEGVCAGGSADLGVGGFVAWVGREVLRVVELRGVDEDRRDDRAPLGGFGGAGDAGGVARVQPPMVGTRTHPRKGRKSSADRSSCTGRSVAGGAGGRRNCTLTDSNGAILGSPVDIGTLPGNAQDLILFQTDLLTCDDDLLAGEPNTATLTCECFADGSGDFRSGTDTASIECQQPAVEIVKDCAERAPLSDTNAITITVTNPVNDNGASLENCVVTDPLAGFTSAPFSLAPGESMGFDTSVSGLTEPTENTAQVVCEIVGSNGKTIENQAVDTCDLSICDVSVDRQVSCDGGATYVDVGFDDAVADACQGTEGGSILVQYRARNNSSRTNGMPAPLVNCTLTDSNGMVVMGSQPVGTLDQGFEGFVFSVDDLTCTDELSAGEPGTVTLTCECFDDTTEVFVEDSDTADFDCIACEVSLDKQISCDGGATFVDVDDVSDGESCTGWDNDAEVVVRYVADNPGNDPVFGCVLTDSNGLVLAGPEAIGSIDANTTDLTIFQTTALECSAELEAGEPNTATLTCECGSEGSGIEASDSDEANIVCQEPALEIEKDCAEQDPLSKVNAVTITVTNPANDRGATLANCIVEDPQAGFTSGSFSLAPGESETFETEINGLTEPTENTATVTCDIVDSAAKTIDAQTTDTCDVAICDVSVDRQVSCDGGVTFVDPGYDDEPIVETCDTIEGEGVIVRYRAANNSSRSNGMPADLFNCVLTDSNGMVLPGSEAIGQLGETFDDFIFTVDELVCSDELTAGEPGLATLTCECFEAGSDNTVNDTDQAGFDCAACEVDIDKQISCDGGATFVDVDDVSDGESCTGWDNDAEVVVRYVADNPGNDPVFGCVLTDSNGLVLAGQETIGTIDGNTTDLTVFQTNALECSAELEAGEPNTATLTCECLDEGSGIERTSTDEANIVCQEPALEIEKDCAEQDPLSKVNAVTITVTNPANDRGATLANCVVEDPQAGFTSGSFSLAPGESETFETEINGLTEPTENTATVTCDIVDSAGKTIDAQTTDTCDVAICDVSVDRQVSCDGGVTFVDPGYDDEPIVETCDTIEGEGVIVRYRAANNSSRSNGMPADLFNCVLTDSNGMVLPGSEAIGQLGETFDDFIFTVDELVCSDELTAGEPGLATLTCECFEAGSDNTVNDTDQAGFDCAACEVDIDKQISCDGGATFVDVDDVSDGESCTGWDNDAEVVVRYVADNPGNDPVFGCVLTDSNGLVLAGQETIGTIDGNTTDLTVFQTNALECSAELEAGEPNTATLTCECLDEGSGIERTSTDEANIVCQEPALEIEKDCAEQDPLSKVNAVTITVTNPANDRGATLANCVVEDPQAGFTSGSFSLAPGESETFETEINGLTEPTENTATVTCDIVDSAGKTIDAQNDRHVRRGHLRRERRPPGFLRRRRDLRRSGLRRRADRRDLRHDRGRGRHRPLPCGEQLVAQQRHAGRSLQLCADRQQRHGPPGLRGDRAARRDVRRLHLHG